MRLLVSVRNAAEARVALAGGADVIDVKEPAMGSLGAAEPATLRAVRAVVTPPVELSAALGDATGPADTLALAGRAAAGCGVEYVKVGLLGVQRPCQALELLAAVRRAAQEAAPRVRVVAVAYADAARVGALPPLLAPALARESGIHGVLLDTAVKDGTTSLTALGERDVATFLEAAREHALLAGLAGSLQPEDLPRARALGADLVGVRGAACDGGRRGDLSPVRVARLLAALREAAPA